MSANAPQDLAAIAARWLSAFAHGFDERSGAAVAKTFLPDGWLRDALVFTWDTRALTGHSVIASYVDDGLARGTLGGPPTTFALDMRTHFAPALLDASKGTAGALELAFTFTAPRGACRGLARLLPDENDEWRALSAFIMLDAFHGHEEVGAELGLYEGNRLPWESVISERRARIEEDPYVIIVGSGQTGLQIAARFKQLGLRTVVLEKLARVGDQWRARYRTLSTNTPKQQHTLLYQPYPTTWPTYTAKEKLADWFEYYSASQDLVVWLSSYIINTPRPVYDAKASRWTISVSHAGKIVILRPAHIILATGTLGPPRMPTIPGASAFLGQTLHASTFYGAAPYAGKKVLVVGAANTGADVAQDLYHSGAASVTMLQRSSTCVVSETWMRAHWAREYPDGIPTDVRDFKSAGFPLGLLERIVRKLKAGGKGPQDNEADKAMKEGMKMRGFRLNEGWEGLGAYFLVLDRFGGHWIDLGCAQLIVDGKVALKAGCELDHFTPDRVVFNDGSTLAVDVVIFATGYESPRQTFRDLLGADVIDATIDIWGRDAEGELRGAYRPTGHPGIWYTAGDFYHSRWGSKQLGLLIQAKQLGYVDS